MLHAILALILLVIATVLGVYKPFGMTAYGTRKQHEQRQGLSLSALEKPATAPRVDSSTTWMYLAGIIAIAIMLLFVLMPTSSSFSH